MPTAKADSAPSIKIKSKRGSDNPTLCFLFVSFSQHHIGDEAEQKNEETQYLSLLKRTDHQAVRTQLFDETSFQRIKHAVQAGDLAGEASPFIQPDEEDEQGEAPDGFVEESGMNVLSICPDCPGKIGRSSVSFLVEKVSPSADGLSQGYRREHQICKFKKVDFIVSADEYSDDDTGDDAAVYSQAAASDVEYFRPVPRIAVPAENDVISSGADDCRGNQKNGKIQDVLTVDARL